MTEPVLSEPKIYCKTYNDMEEDIEWKPGHKKFRPEVPRFVTLEDYRALAAKVEALVRRIETEEPIFKDLMQQLAAARLECAEHKERALRVLRRDFTQICSYCGWEATREGAKWEDLQAHIHTCPQHPIMTLQARVRELEGAIGVIVKANDASCGGLPDCGHWWDDLKKALAPGAGR